MIIGLSGIDIHFGIMIKMFDLGALLTSFICQSQKRLWLIAEIKL